MNLTRRGYLTPSFNNGFNLLRDFDDIFRNLSRDLALDTPTSKSFSPQAEIKENAKGYLISFDVPGIKEDDIKIDFHDSVLRIQGERKTEHKDEQNGLFRTEKHYGHFERSFRLSDTVDEANVEANFENGVLQVFLPKLPTKESKRIEIKKGEGSSFRNLFSKLEQPDKSEH